MTQLLLTSFTAAQINLIVAIAVVFAALFVGNSVLLGVLFYKRKKRKLCTAALQERREQLLDELAQLRYLQAQSAEPDEDDDEENFDEGIDEEDEADAGALADDGKDEVAVSENGAFRMRVLPVSEMSVRMRQTFGFLGTEYDEKRYYVRYSYGFEAKLRGANEQVKARYCGLIDETGRYKKLTVACGFRRQRIAYGRKTVGLIFFKGKTLCVALALPPKEFENTKYRGIDASAIKRFDKTPLLLKLTSERRLGYAKYLLNRLAEKLAIAMYETPLQLDYSVECMTRDELFAEGLLKIAVVGEVPEETNLD